SGLLRLRLQSLGVAAVGVLDFAAALAVLGAKQIAQDREQPRGHVGPALERIDIGERAQQGFLHEVVGAVDVAAERDGEGAQVRNRRQDGLAHRWIEIHAFFLCARYEPLSSRFSRRSRRSTKRAGTPWLTTSS